MTNVSCPWNLFNEEEGYDLEIQMHIMGNISATFALWLLIASCYPAIRDNMSYLNVWVFMTSGWIRRSISFLTTLILHRDDKYRHAMVLCRVFGFIETFMAVLEVECLTHLCIERYVVAKYNANGWPMVRKHYVMFWLLSLMFASIYSIAPVLFFAGYGGYGLDFTCTSCTMNMVLTDGFMKYCAAAIFALRSIKPAGFMIIMLIWAKRLESTFPDTAKNREQKQVTEDVIVITVVNLVCWSPIFIIRGWVVLSQLFYGPGVLPLPDPYIVKAAMLIHWNSLGCTVMSLLFISARVREAASKVRIDHVYDVISHVFKPKQE